MKTALYAKAKLNVIDRETGHVVCSIPWERNLVFDSGLNALANGLGFANIFTTCKVGSSNSANVIPSVAVTFTQTGNTITASAPFFTSGMTGALFKYGVGSSGLETYLVFTDSTHAASSVSATVASPTVATVYLVQQTSLVSYLYKSQSYQTGSSNCGTSFSGSQVISQRTYNFANQAGSYNVNEIGYVDNNTNDGSCYGRIVLPSTTVVAPSQFLQVVMTMTFSVSPNAQSSVANVGTNINTAGTVMYNQFDCQIVQSSGLSGSAQNFAASNMMDICQNIEVGIVLTTTTLNTSIQNAPNPILSALLLNSGSISNSGQGVGVGLASFTYAITTSGQSAAGFVFGAGLAGSQIATTFALNFSNPQTLPVGTFAGTIQFTNTFGRTLTN